VAVVDRDDPRPAKCARREREDVDQRRERDVEAAEAPRKRELARVPANAADELRGVVVRRIDELGVESGASPASTAAASAARELGKTNAARSTTAD
jgi:hypothetical protein